MGQEAGLLITRSDAQSGSRADGSVSVFPAGREAPRPYPFRVRQAAFAIPAFAILAFAIPAFAIPPREKS